MKCLVPPPSPPPQKNPHKQTNTFYHGKYARKNKNKNASASGFGFYSKVNYISVIDPQDLF